MNVFVLTGAGISAESGLPTFRDANGLWERHRPEDLATPEAFKRDPALVRRFYDARREALKGVLPNAAHYALARLGTEAKAHGHDVFVCTQNVDDLHERAGSHDVFHMHGELRKGRCTACEAVVVWDGPMSPADECSNCKSVDTMRPHVVWFGEIPLGMDTISEKLSKADVFAAIGTSGTVYPAAGFVRAARSRGTHTIHFNLDAAGSHAFHERFVGPSATTVPRWVESVMSLAEG